jgi:hypothetical protein
VVCDQIVSRENKATIFELHIVFNVLDEKQKYLVKIGIQHEINNA